MYSFLNDYSEGAHPKVLKALIDSNSIQTVGYGEDEYCKKAKEAIYKRIHDKDAEIQFLVGGTQTNATVIASALKPYQAVIAVDEGHINVHETGAIEATGHKVLTRPHHDGKLTVEDIEGIVSSHTDEHMVQPKMVYISQTTELGSYYTLNEIKTISAYCRKHDLYLFVDGARLGSALAIADAPTMKDLAHYCDVFYIGGTKMGALFGEAVVILHKDLKKDFRYHIKQRGGMLAKGRLLGVMFHALLEDDTYEQIGAYENSLANEIKDAFVKKNLPLVVDSCTNQIFVDLPNSILKELEKEFLITRIKSIDSSTTRVRFVTSWATKKEEVKKLVKLIQNS